MQSKRVLHIDPCPDNRFLFRAVVNRRGHEIREARSISELKVVWRPEHFDLVIISIGHADNMGLRACEYIRQQDGSVPIFVYSSSASGDGKPPAEISGITGAYLKFEDFTRLIEDIDGILKDGGKVKTPPAPAPSLQAANSCQ